jgi:hypothetical protein
VAECVTTEGKRLLRQGGSIGWLLNNCCTLDDLSGVPQVELLNQ